MILELSKHLKLDLPTIRSANLVPELDEADLENLGEWCWTGYDADVVSRANWFRRNEAGMDLAMQLVKEKSFPWPGCFSLDTDILTENGWKPVADVLVGECVLTRAPDGTASYAPVTATTRHPVPNGRMVYFEGKSISLLVTEDHHMLVLDKKGRPGFFKASEFLSHAFNTSYIPLTSRSIRKSPETVYGMPTKAYMRLLGWFLSEGWTYRPQNHTQAGFVDTTGSFGIAQSREANPVRYAILEQDLANTGLSYAEQSRGFTLHARSMPEELKEEFRSLGKCDEKRIPRHALGYGVDDLRALLTTLIFGDGTVPEDKNLTLYTSSLGLADDVQELCQYIGLRGTVSIDAEAGEGGGRIRGKLVYNTKTVYAVSVNKKSVIQTQKLYRHSVPVPADTEVACVTVEPYHTLYVRRGGKAVWCGNCANVAFPLVTIATLQFHSRAYPELVPGKDLVQYEVWGEDPESKEAARAARIGAHMSHQCLKEDEAWQDNHDKLMINYSVVGSAFIKSRRSTAENKNVSDFVPARYLVMDYWAKSVESCGRKTHLIPLSRNDIVERVRKGTWKDILDAPWYKAGGEADQKQQEREAGKDRRAGLEMPPPDDLTPFWFGEQHTWVDFDGDGYAEPVIITFELNSKSVVRVVYRFDREEDILRNDAKEIIRIRPEEQFTRYEFIPSPDGGVYGLGWGLLVGPLNESVSSLINQLLDSGTVGNTAGGFLARNAKLRGGKYTFSPFEWLTVDVAGGTLKENMVPLPVREPSDVLYKLLVLLIDYSNRICASTEMLAGENPGQNTPAQTSAAMVEQGMKIFASIFTRAWRCMKEEFKKIYLLNAVYTDPGKPLPGFASLEDYKGDPSRISPSADPTVLSETQRLLKATALRQAAYTAPGYDIEAVETYYLKALRVPNWQTFYKGKDKVPPLPNFKMQVEQLKLQGIQMKLKQQQMEFTFGLLEEKRLNDAKILQLEAMAAKLVEEAGGIASGQRLEAFKGVIEIMKGRQELIGKQFDLMMQQMKTQSEGEGKDESDSGNVRRVAGASGHSGSAATSAGATTKGNGAMGAGEIHA